MQSEVFNISRKECYLFIQPTSKYLLIQPVDEHDLELLNKEVAMIQQLSDIPFSLAAFKINDWNHELSPWLAPPVFGKIQFGDGAAETLSFITEQLIPGLKAKGIDTSHCLLGGYSLAGLFSLWASYQSNVFEGIAAASPSVWFPNWIDYAAARQPFAKAIYLSLGDKEEKAKNPIMAQVGNAIRLQHELLQSYNLPSILEWNPGNHFADSEKRIAKGFAWLLSKNIS